MFNILTKKDKTEGLADASQEPHAANTGKIQRIFITLFNHLDWIYASFYIAPTFILFTYLFSDFPLAWVPEMTLQVSKVYGLSSWLAHGLLLNRLGQLIRTWRNHQTRGLHIFLLGYNLLGILCHLLFFCFAAIGSLKYIG